MNYGQMRRQWCRAVVLAFVKRWATYLLVGGAVLAGSASAFGAAFVALAAWSVFPLFLAVQSSWILGAAVCVLHASVGSALVWGLRPVLWPLRWAEVEHALPVPAQHKRASDLQVVIAVLVPLFALYLAGAAAVMAHGTAQPGVIRLGQSALLLASMALSVAAGLGFLQRFRQAAVHRPYSTPARASVPVPSRASTDRAVIQTEGVLQVLFIGPLLRGPARRVARHLVLSLLVLLVLIGAMAVLRGPSGWWLSGFALLSLAATTRLSSLTTTYLAPLHQAAVHLPLNAVHLRRGRWGLVLLPGTTALVALLITLAGLQTPGMRWGALLGFALAVWGGQAVQVGLAIRTSESQVARWLLSLVVMVAFASEVFP